MGRSRSRGPDRRASLPVHLEVVSRVWRLRTDSWTPRRRGAHLKAVEGGQKLKPSDSTDGDSQLAGGLAAGPEEGSRPYRENASGLSFGPSRPDSPLSAHVPIMPITREQPSSGLPECRSAGFERRVGVLTATVTATRLDDLHPSDTNEHDSSAPQTATNRLRCFARTYGSEGRTATSLTGPRPAGAGQLRVFVAR
jgi:hypothetical protein